MGLPRPVGPPGVQASSVMSSALDTLTEKEKQALRLLVSGYDAKSMAHHLGLSIHTINERLREARRKLQVSSSREAARRLREAEQVGAPNFDPQNHGPTLLGDARGDALLTEARPPAGAATSPHRAGWMIGATVMSILLAIAAFSGFSADNAAPVAAAPSAAETAVAETDAVRAARAWLALVDAGDWSGSWEAASQTFRALNTRERWTEVAQSVQTPLGRVIAHRLVGAEFVPAPPAGYQLVKFRSHYANRPDAVLSLSLVQEDARWKVTGILID